MCKVRNYLCIAGDFHRRRVIIDCAGDEVKMRVTWQAWCRLHGDRQAIQTDTSGYKLYQYTCIRCKRGIRRLSCRHMHIVFVV